MTYRSSANNSPSTSGAGAQANTTAHKTPALAEGFVLLDNSTSLEAVSQLFEHPAEIIRADSPEEVDAALAALTSGLERGLHAAGFFSYELGYLLEPRLASLLPERRKMPLLWFGLYTSPRELMGSEVQEWLNQEAIGNPTLGELAHSWDSASYLKRFEQVQNNIKSGDIYQLNLTFKAKFNLQGSPLALYRDLRLKQRVAYAGIVDTGDVTILSASPELFIKQDGRVIETRPMKGTAPRAGTLDADSEVRAALSKDVKNRAENLMIVDLMRNDLGRISDPGSVSVTDLFTVETFKTLHQMTSGVRAELKPGTGLVDVLKAIFPPGSITGAPKIRAMELIRELETEPRGVYCGAIGRFSPDGTALLNVAIRTTVIDRKGAGEMGIGSGIVADSDGIKEYAECLLKMKFLTDPVRRFELIETMLHEPEKGIWLRGYHLARLAASAAYFGFVFDASKVHDAIEAAISGNANERLRVRLLLDEDGGVTVTTAPQPAAPADAVMRYVVSDSRLNSSDLFLYHKTTRRELYDREWKHYADTLGADEVIYLNEAGELAEGSRTSIFIARDGKLLTPRLAAGVLPGTLRAALIDEGRAEEARLTIQDLNGAAEIYLGNSVRGLVRAEPLVPRLAVDHRQHA
ncbi:para-aminobenzoate synthase, subunit I [Hyphomicrobium denitrificans ATCC 51888]|uniref:Probable branched-chain-amino-acid aminotransferase n=1 Tax=Hyphomicrobium denitrificans (strain ATCC 51888 / DSM 1869 / NCIMB 11706 / TK 0415) TaxID=582899 RepID=D8JUU1_HYPDA|nr:aminodeoxychorismate synthase component I [Hyphomicrobium denitrificans]ADJ24721.1 para-aminobenzoate synthase, subunit I [Hyphomicrobium denitrificans ATCC 51888]